MVRFLIFILLVAISIQGKSSCICGDTPNVRSAVQEAQSVFYGRVEEIALLNPFDYLVKLKVYKSWKLAQEDYVWLASTKSDKECGVDFVTGHEYLVYTYSVTPNLLSASKCGRTQQWLRVAESEKKLLGKVIYSNEMG